jgi:beta-lactamase class A
VAAVATKNGMVIISIFTYDNADQSWTSDDEGDVTIAKLARAIVNTWSPQGLTAWPAAKTK